MTFVGHLDADRLSAPGGQPALLVDAANWRRPEVDIQSVVVGLDAEGTLPPAHTEDFDLLLTTSGTAPAPWVSLRNFNKQVNRLEKAIVAYPLASTIAACVLRAGEHMPFADALRLESLGYSTLLGGKEFAGWRAANHAHKALSPPTYPVIVQRSDEHIGLTLNDPESGNAMTATMRDALYEALANALDDPASPTVTLDGAGRCFSTGGALAEFGSAIDLAEAHAVRTLRSCARALNNLRTRGVVRFHGACIGSGVEIGAAAHKRFATGHAWFQLPEIRMGLIPGAGGTVTVSRAIGRHRTLWMLLSGARISAIQALDWGLIHSIEDRR